MDFLKKLWAVMAAAALSALPGRLAADPGRDPPTDPPPAKTRTFGGIQFWSDELVYHDWRIQRHVLTDHYRLLDDQDYRRAWGSFSDCRDQLEAFKQKLDLPPLRGKVVLVVHGLGRSRNSMTKLVQHLRDHSDFLVLNVSYASTRRTMADHAASLSRVVANLGDDIQEINFVAHSMGNLVIRRYLGGLDAVGAESWKVPKRVVMLAPPNNGSILAERFRANSVFKTFWGNSGREIAAWEQLEKNLATPACFGILAGGRGDDEGRNPLIPGDDDFVVSVEETRLPGARDFAVLPTVHGLIMDHPQSCEFALRFLQHGYFIADDQRHPIPIPPAAAHDEP